MEGIHTGLLRKITEKRARLQRDGESETPGAEGIREAAGTQSARTYKGRRQETVTQWVALRTLFEGCAIET